MPDPTTRTPPEFLLLGEVLRPHGIRGELRVRILTDYPERIAGLEQVHFGTDPHSPPLSTHSVQHMRMHKNYGLLKLTGVDDRAAADLFREQFVMVRIEDAVPLDEGEFYLYELIGARIQTTDGRKLGAIVEVLETGANDVYIVASPEYGEILVPVTDETIIATDIEAGILTVELPEGLLPD